MKYVNESLYEFQTRLFFERIYEEENKVSPKKTKKHLEEDRKTGIDIVKKSKDNFARFKSAAGNKIAEYKKFWELQGTAKSIWKKFGLPDMQGMFYTMFDSGYIIALLTSELKDVQNQLVVVDTNADSKDMAVIYSCMDKEVHKAFADFFQNDFKATMKEQINSYKQKVEARQREEEAKKQAAEDTKKKERINKFLKESQSPKYLRKTTKY